MHETTVQPAYRITYLGSTDLYDVYDVVIYPRLVSDVQAQASYKRRVQRDLEEAKLNRRKIWGAVDLSRLSLPQLVTLAYRVTLPFIRQPMVFKIYSVGNVRYEDENTRTLDWLLRQTFRMALMPNREAALPPRFVVTQRAERAVAPTSAGTQYDDRLL